LLSAPQGFFPWPPLGLELAIGLDSSLLSLDKLLFLLPDRSFPQSKVGVIIG